MLCRKSRKSFEKRCHVGHNPYELGLKTHIQNYPGKVGEAARDMHVLNLGLGTLLYLTKSPAIHHYSDSAEFQPCCHYTSLSSPIPLLF